MVYILHYVYVNCDFFILVFYYNKFKYHIILIIFS
jgi:hypothetical protein